MAFVKENGFVILLLGLMVGFIGYRSTHCGSGQCGVLIPFVEAQSQSVSFSCPSLVCQTPQGQAYDPSVHEGKVVVLNFWSTHCSACIKTLPELNAVSLELPKDDVAVVCVAIQNDAESVAEFSEKSTAGFDVVLGNPDFLAQFEGLSQIPYTLLVNRQGEVVMRYEGFVGRERLLKDIKNIL